MLDVDASMHLPPRTPILVGKRMEYCGVNSDKRLLIQVDLIISLTERGMRYGLSFHHRKTSIGIIALG